MRVALVEWYPRVCGSVEWAFHMAHGAVGGRGRPTIELLSFTKSGRARARWYHGERWQTHKLASAASVLNDYDLVVLCDLVCFAPETVNKQGGPAYYAEVMRQVKTPWTAMYHGGIYQSKHDATIGALLESRGFCGRLITTRIDNALERLAPFGIGRDAFVFHPYLPYALDYHGLTEVRSPKNRKRRSVLMTSRIAVNKGQNTAFAIAQQLDVDVELWGYNAFGLPSIAWRLWELGTGLKFRQVKKPKLRRDKRSLTHPHAVRFYTGEFALGAKAKRAVVSYRDGFDEVREVDWSPWVHLNLTSADFHGSVEYSSLDAIAAGAIAVVPDHALELPRYAHGSPIGVPFRKDTTWWRDTGKVSGNADYGVALFDRINELLKGSSDAKLERLRSNQFEMLRDRHDAGKIATKLIKEVTR